MKTKKGEDKTWTVNSKEGIEKAKIVRNEIRLMKQSNAFSVKEIQQKYKVSRAQTYRIEKEDSKGPKQRGKKQKLTEEQRVSILQTFLKNQGINDFQKVKKNVFINFLKAYLNKNSKNGVVKYSTNFYYPEYKRFLVLYESSNFKKIPQNYNSNISAESYQAQTNQTSFFHEEKSMMDQISYQEYDNEEKPSIISELESGDQDNSTQMSIQNNFGSQDQINELSQSLHFLTENVSFYQEDYQPNCDTNHHIIEIPTKTTQTNNFCTEEYQQQLEFQDYNYFNSSYKIYSNNKSNEIEKPIIDQNDDIDRYFNFENNEQDEEIDF